MKFAVIDLGSNTFHLMIVKISGERFIPSDILYRESYMTSLSSGGGKTILQKNWDDALQTAEKIKSVLNFYHVENIKITGTAVLRTADNRKEFLQQMEAILQNPVHVIDGSMEANYIGEGSLLHPVLKEGKHLILDIGGGSTECILLDNGGIGPKASFHLGIGVLKKMFFTEEVITQKQIIAASEYTDKTISTFMEELKNVPIDSLTGASGTFEAIEKILFGKTEYGIHANNISISIFKKLYGGLIFSYLESRLQYSNMPKERAPLIPVGLFLIHYFINKINPKEINISHFALKEGILLEMLKNTHKNSGR
ncbi:MAG: hypothetical protein IPK25_05205 [Saprospiraceae bacterium]|nr:hypothetical protein [Saprospiraceae bacterium]